MTHYAIELDSAGLLLEVRLNDVRIYRDSSAVPRIREDRVNHWIVPGENTLELWLGLPAESASGDGDPSSFELEWLTWDSADSRQKADRIAGYRWRGELKLERGVMRRAWDAVVTPGVDFGRWAWQDSIAELPEERDRAEILQILMELHLGIERREIGAVRDKLILQNAEMARAFGHDPDDRERRQRAFLESCVAASRWRVEPLRPAELLFHPQAGGKLVFVTDAGGLPPIRGVSQSTTFDLPCGFSRVGGKWTVVR